VRTFSVEVFIENKPVARDPEGETIRRDLLSKGGYQAVKSVRTGKYLRVAVEAENGDQAKEIVLEICNSLRIYNPVVHTFRIELRGEG